MGLTLREGDREYFYEKLDAHFPQLKHKYQTKYGNSYILKSDKNKELMELFYKTCHENNIVCNNDALFSYMNIFKEKNKIRQLNLFE
jgi:hypothetical protein